MKSVAVLCLLVVTLALAEGARISRDTTYTTKYDNIDLDEILSNTRLLTSYFNCLMERGRCTPDGNELKKDIGDALQTQCAKCSEKQKAGAEKVIKYLINNDPEKWDDLKKKYDTEGKYSQKYEEQEKKLKSGQSVVGAH